MEGPDWISESRLRYFYDLPAAAKAYEARVLPEPAEDSFPDSLSSVDSAFWSQGWMAELVALVDVRNARP